MTHVPQGSPHDGWLDKAAFHRIFITHILGDIEFCIDNGRYLAAAQLLLSAIDTAAGLDRPLTQIDTNKSAFIAWADEFLALTGHNYRIDGWDLYGSRCGFLHGYTPIASAVAAGKASLIVWKDSMEPPVALDAQRGIAVVSLRHLASAYGQGLKATMVRINGDRHLSAIVNQRLRHMFYTA